MPERRFDAAVLGAGVAGLAAALRLARSGASVALVDEAPSPGGRARLGPGAGRAGDLYREALTAGVVPCLGESVWSLEPAFTLRLAATDPAHAVTADTVRVRGLVLCTGLVEQPPALPGGTLPGVLLWTAVRLMLRDGALPRGVRVAVVGPQPAAEALAAELRAAGAEISGIASDGEAGTAPQARMVHGHGRAGALEVAVPRSDNAPAIETWPADLVAVAGTPAPLTEAAALLGCPLTWIPELGGFVPLHSAAMETPIDGLFVAGGITGTVSGELAQAQGLVAGLSCATVIFDHVPHAQRAAAAERLRKAERLEAGSSRPAGRAHLQEIWRAR